MQENDINNCIKLAKSKIAIFKQNQEKVRLKSVVNPSIISYIQNAFPISPLQDMDVSFCQVTI